MIKSGPALSALDPLLVTGHEHLLDQLVHQLATSAMREHDVQLIGDWNGAAKRNNELKRYKRLQGESCTR